MQGYTFEANRPASLAGSDGLETFLRESATGRGFQVTFKLYRAIPTAKCNGGLDPRWAEFGRVGNLSSIVTPQSIAEVFGQADVKVFEMCFAFQDIAVACNCLARLRALRYGAAVFALALRSERRLEAAGVEPASLTDLPAATTCLVG